MNSFEMGSNNSKNDLDMSSRVRHLPYAFTYVPGESPRNGNYFSAVIGSYISHKALHLKNNTTAISTEINHIIEIILITFVTQRIFVRVKYAMES
ncbi:hypothetical protein PR048_012678, partial [Dryococelus australis]